LTEDGALFTWQTRRNVDDDPDEPVPQLGHGRFVHDFGVPHRVLAFNAVRIASVAVGAGFTVAVTKAGAVYSFGMADERLGLGRAMRMRACSFPSASRRWMVSMWRQSLREESML
jgi:alpha-tubulin suppressor-like RCC1 family protein